MLVASAPTWLVDWPRTSASAGTSPVERNCSSPPANGTVAFAAVQCARPRQNAGSAKASISTPARACSRTFARVHSAVRSAPVSWPSSQASASGRKYRWRVPPTRHRRTTAGTSGARCARARPARGAIAVECAAVLREPAARTQELRQHLLLQLLQRAARDAARARPADLVRQERRKLLRQHQHRQLRRRQPLDVPRRRRRGIAQQHPEEAVRRRASGSTADRRSAETRCVPSARPARGLCTSTGPARRPAPSATGSRRTARSRRRSVRTYAMILRFCGRTNSSVPRPKH